MLDESRAIKLTYAVASQGCNGGQVLLTTPSDSQEGWHIPPQEIYLSVGDIKRLYDMVKEK